MEGPQAKKSCGSGAWTKDTMQFYNIKLGVSERIEDFYMRLVELAEKTFDCTDASSKCHERFQEQMIRSRLMASIDEDLCTEILSVNSNPSVTEIFEYHNEDQKFCNRAEWPLILSYLTLADIESFSQANLKLKRVVKTYLAKGNELVVDVASLVKYPVRSNSTLYKYYGSYTTNIRIIGVLTFELRKLHEWFPNITVLTLKGVKIWSEGSKYHWPLLTKLAFDCGNYAFSLELYFGPLTELTELRMDGYGEVSLSHLPKLHSLIVAKEMICSGIANSPVQRLTIEQCWESFAYEHVKTMQQLKHLRVSRGVDVKAKEEIEALSLPSVDYFCYESPAKENLFLELNDDCLLHLQLFLDIQDVIALFKTHPRFRTLRISKFFMDDRFHEVMTLEEVKEMAPLILQTQVFRMGGSLFQELMPLFANLQELNIRLKETASSQYLSFIPNGLRALSLMDLDQDPSDLYRRMNATLNSLHFKSKDTSLNFSGIDALQNIREFGCSGEVQITEEFLRFLRQNKEHMQDLKLENGNDTELDSEMWQVIGGMRKLKKLKIARPGKIPNGSFPELENLSIDFNFFGGEVEFLNSLDGSKLVTVSIRSFREADADVINALLRFKKLEKFYVAHNFAGDLLKLVQGLPHLKHISRGSFDGDRDIDLLIQIREYCVNTNRKLMIDYVQLV